MPERTRGIALTLVLLLAMLLPMLILYAVGSLGVWLAPSLNLSVSQLGLFALTSFGVAALLSPVSGGWAGRVGTRMALRALFFSVAAAYTLLALAHSLWLALVAACLCGIAQALANPATNLLIRQRVAVRNRARVVGMKQSGVQMAALLAGLLLPLVASHWNWRVGFLMLLPVSIGLILLAPVVAPTSAEGPVPSTSIDTGPNRLLRGLMAVQWLAGMALSAFVTFVSNDAQSRGVAVVAAGQLLAWFGVAGMLSRLILTPWADRLRDEYSMLAVLFAVAAVAVLPLVTDLGNRYWLWPLSAFLMGGSAVATNAIAMSMVIKDRAFGSLAPASGWLSSAFFTGLAIGPVTFAGFLSSFTEYRLAWAWLLFLLVIGAMLCLALRFFRRRQRLPELAFGEGDA